MSMRVVPRILFLFIRPGIQETVFRDFLLCWKSSSRSTRQEKGGQTMTDKNMYRDTIVKDIDESCIGKTIKAA